MEFGKAPHTKGNQNQSACSLVCVIHFRCFVYSSVMTMTNWSCEMLVWQSSPDGDPPLSNLDFDVGEKKKRIKLMEKLTTSSCGGTRHHPAPATALCRTSNTRCLLPPEDGHNKQAAVYKNSRRFTVENEIQKKISPSWAAVHYSLTLSTSWAWVAS